MWFLILLAIILLFVFGYKKAQKQMKITIEKSLMKVNYMIEDKELKNMFNNFIAKFKPILASYPHILVFEKLLYNDLKFFATDYLWSGENAETKKQLLLSMEQFKQVMDKNFGANFVDSVKNYLYNDFDNFYTVVNKRMNFENKFEGYFLIWLTMRKLSILFHANAFEYEYPNFCNEIEGLNLKDSVSKYVYLDMVNIGDISTDTVLFTYYLMSKSKFEGTTYENDNLIDCMQGMSKLLEEAGKNKDIEILERKITLNSSNDQINNNRININDTDLMSGHEFEEFVSRVYQNLGYKTLVTKGSGDQGIDVIIEKNGQKYGVQTKCYSKPVTNKAVQEVVAGLNFYGLNKGIVVTNSTFTNSAIELANTNGIVLWDRNKLEEKINEAFLVGTIL